MKSVRRVCALVVVFVMLFNLILTSASAESQSELSSTHQKKKVEIAFLIDASGSMNPYINQVKNNIQKFSEFLESQNVILRMAIIRFGHKMDGNRAHVLKINGSSWHTSTEQLVQTLSNIDADGGTEALSDALGDMIHNEANSNIPNIYWSSDAYKFAFVLTNDFDNGVEGFYYNDYNYKSLDSIIPDLKAKRIPVSVVTESYYYDFYKNLTQKTGGNLYNINSNDYLGLLISYAKKVLEMTMKKDKAIYVLPGYLGSRLYVNEGTNNASIADGEEYWTKSIADVLKKKITPSLNSNDDENDGVWLMKNDNNGANSKLHADMNKDLYGTEDFYKNVITKLKEKCSDYDVIFFPYNWTGDLNDSSKLLQDHIKEQGYKKVVFVTHSTGALLASAYIAHSRENKLKVEKAILVAPPLYGTYASLEPLEIGANKELDDKINEQMWWPFNYHGQSVAHNWVRNTLKNSPTTYQLLPSKEYLGIEPMQFIEIKTVGKRKMKRTKKLIDTDLKFYQVLNGSPHINKNLTNGNERSHKKFRDKLGNIHQLWDANVIKSLQEVDTIIVGTSGGHLTPASASYSGFASGYTNLQNIKKTRNGDGTVLNISAFALDANKNHILNYKDYNIKDHGYDHGGLITQETPISFICDYINKKEDRQGVSRFATYAMDMSEDTNSMSNFLKIYYQANAHVNIDIYNEAKEKVAVLSKDEYRGFDSKILDYTSLHYEEDNQEGVLYIPNEGYQITFTKAVKSKENLGNDTGTSLDENTITPEGEKKTQEESIKLEKESEEELLNTEVTGGETITSQVEKQENNETTETIENSKTAPNTQNNEDNRTIQNTGTIQNIENSQDTERIGETEEDPENVQKIEVNEVSEESENYKNTDNTETTDKAIQSEDTTKTIVETSENPEVSSETKKNTENEDFMFYIEVSTLDEDGNDLKNVSKVIDQSENNVVLFSLDGTQARIDNENIETLVDGDVLKYLTNWSLPTSLVVEIDESLKLEPEGEDAKEVLDSLKWFSSDDTIIAVSEQGEFEIKDYGSVTISATDGNKISVCRVTVKKEAQDVNFKDIEMQINERVLIQPEFIPANTTQREIVYTIEKEGIIEIDHNGVILALDAGTLKVTGVTENNIENSFQVTVIDNRVHSVKSVEALATQNIVEVGAEVMVKAKINPANATNLKITWDLNEEEWQVLEKSDQEIKIKALKEGENKITAVTVDGGYTSTVTINVVKDPVFNIVLNTNGGGSVSGGGSFMIGTKVAVKALAQEGFAFEGWFENGKLLMDAKEEYAFEVTSNRNLEARFKKKEIQPKSSQSESNSFPDYNSLSLATSNNSQVKANKGAQEFVLINGKKSNIKVTSDGSFTIKQEDLKGLILPVYIRFPYSLKNLQHANTLVYVLEKSGNKQILPFSFYQNGEIKLLISEAGNYVLSDLNPSFDDIDTHWAKEAIVFNAARKIFSGVGNKLFQPETPITRAMFVQVLANLESGTLKKTEQSSFIDVETDAWYSPAVEWANQNHIIRGYGNRQFAPNDLITREQMAVILHQYLKFKNIKLKKREYSEFEDKSDIHSWAKEAVAEMRAYELISGTGENLFSPLAYADRGSVATLLMNLIEKVLQE